MKKQVKVEWVFAEKPAPPPMRRLRNGQSIAIGEHDLRPEGIPTKRIYCYGCKQYFPSWHHALYKHGMCKEKPKGYRA